MESTSREYAKFKRLFVGPKIKRKQRLALAPAMPADAPPRSKRKPFYELSETEKKKALWSAYIVERRKKRDKSMPAWADKKAIQEIYKQARYLTKSTGIKHKVDHIIPSNHPLVCGLHVESNLQILTEQENCCKSNSFNID